MKKTILHLVSLFSFISAFSQSPNWLWIKNSTETGGGAGEGRAVKTDANNNALVTGYFNGTINFGGIVLTSAGNSDIFTVKYDAAGNVLWAKRAGGASIDEGQSISSDVNNNVIVTGFFSSPAITFGSIVLTNTGTTGADIFVVKYDASGNVLWAKNDGGTGGDFANGVSTDADANVAITGYFPSPSFTFGSTVLTNAGFSNVFVIKYDSAGTRLWAKSAGGTIDDRSYGISADANDNVLVIGKFNSPSISFASTILTNAGGLDIFVAKYDSSGTLLWAERAGGIVLQSSLAALRLLLRLQIALLPDVTLSLL